MKQSKTQTNKQTDRPWSLFDTESSRLVEDSALAGVQALSPSPVTMTTAPSNREGYVCMEGGISPHTIMALLHLSQLTVWDASNESWAMRSESLLGSCRHCEDMLSRRSFSSWVRSHDVSARPEERRRSFFWDQASSSTFTTYSTRTTRHVW